MKALTVTGSPSFCWQCMRQLRRAPGRGKGLFYAEIVLDPIGQQHRVHKDCVRGAVGDGIKHIPHREVAA